MTSQEFLMKKRFEKSLWSTCSFLLLVLLGLFDTAGHRHRYASAWTSIEAGEALSPVQATKSAPSDAAFSRASLRAFIKPVCECTPDCRDEPWTMPRNRQLLAAAPRSISRICAAAGLSVVAHPTRAKTRSLVILARLATPAGRVTDSQAPLTNGPIADKTLTLARAMAKDALHGKGPVFRTLREIAALPEDQRFDAFVDRLDMLDADELAKVVKNKAGEVMYAATSNKVRLSILEVGKQWLVDEQAKGNQVGAGKLAALSVFNGQRKAG